MLTDGPNSYMATVDLDSDEWLDIDDVFEHDDMTWRITRLESKNGPLEGIEATNLVRAVALRQDMLRVKITKTRGEFSTPDTLIVEEGTVFKAGTIMEIGAQTWRIRAIHTGQGRTPSEEPLMLQTSNGCISMNLQGRSASNRRRRESDAKHGRKAVLGSIQIQSCRKSKSKSASSQQIDERERNLAIDQGRFVHGIKKAFAICNPMVGFSCNLRMLYSYHFSPYGM